MTPSMFIDDLRYGGGANAILLSNGLDGLLSLKSKSLSCRHRLSEFANLLSLCLREFGHSMRTANWSNSSKFAVGMKVILTGRYVLQIIQAIIGRNSVLVIHLAFVNALECGTYQSVNRKSRWNPIDIQLYSAIAELYMLNLKQLAGSKTPHRSKIANLVKCLKSRDWPPRFHLPILIEGGHSWQQ